MATRRGLAALPDELPPSEESMTLLARAEAELVAASLAGSAAERFVHAHLAALRSGAAVLATTGRPGGRSAPRTVWDMVALRAPELERWTAWFAAGAPLRAAVESGRETEVEDDRADRAVAAAEVFLEAVRAFVAPATVNQGSLALRAS